MNRSIRLAGRLLSGAVVVAGAACASAAGPTQRTETVYIPGATGAMSVTGENGSVSVTLAAPLQSVWRLVPMAFDSAGVPLSLIDPKTHAIGNEGFKVRQKLGKERLSTYFECGTTQVGPNADSYELFITVMSHLQPVKGDTTKTRMTVQVTGAAKPLQFAQDYSRCTSKTMLERRMLDVVSGALKR
jgi:hypothetical protein